MKVEGMKRWILFPPDQCTPESIFMEDPQIPSVIWFRERYDAAMQAHPNAVEVLQHPGETVYVPAGWPHLVLNLELSVAITHNYATPYPSIERLFEQVSAAEPQTAELLINAMNANCSDLK